MEKRNRHHRRGQSPPPDGSKVNAARVAAVLVLATGFVILALVAVASLGAGRSMLIGAGLLTTALAAATAWLGLRAALVNYETAKLNLKAAERRADSTDGGREGSGG